MAPVPSYNARLIRPEPILSSSSAGFIAQRRISSSKRNGLIWSCPENPSVPAITPPTAGELAAMIAVVNETSSFQPAMVGYSMRVHARKRRRMELDGEREMRTILTSLSKHTWDLASYLNGVAEADILAAMAPSGLNLPRHRASAVAGPSSLKDAETDMDHFVLALARWFKSDYMSWIDPIRCPQCGGSTKGGGSALPTPTEQADGGGRVELHQCEKPGCGAIRRFVRYGKIGPLLRTREGRCGEWAHLFYAFLRVAGVEARYVWDSEDHVWAEYWSPNKQHWVHVDPCEAAVDKPLLYEQGWGKKQAFCLAIGPRGAEDVTAVYVADHEACLTRRREKGWGERTLALALEQITVSLQLQADPAEMTVWQTMLQKQHAWKADTKSRLAEAEREELGGRISGPEEWRKMRDELGEAVILRPAYTLKRELHDLKASDVYLFGDASRCGSGVILTHAKSQTGGVFADLSLSQSMSFRSTMVFRLTSPAGAGEADGMGIVFARERKLGLGGYGLGYSGLGGKGDFAVEIDTYRTQDHADDPPTPHISVHSPPHAHHRHSIACTKPGQVPFLSGGQAWKLELLYNGRTRRLVGWLSQTQDGDGSGRTDEVNLWETIVPSADGDQAGKWYIGVTGSCGGLWQKQEVLLWSISEIDIGEAARTTVASDTENIEQDAIRCI